jgi:cell pole-organizing protein PopZ
MGVVANEPSMDEILSSIKRIIADGSERTPAGRPARRRPSAVSVELVDGDEDAQVLELTDAVPERDEMDLAGHEAEAPVQSANPILSQSSAEAARHHLSSLSAMLVRPDEGPSNTLEGLVREMLKPMLKEWLDANLPAMVETMVSKEIDRITGRL